VIDLHCHILPGLDDGAADIRDSLGMGRQAETNGVTQVCATPHIRHDHDVVIGELADRVAALNLALGQAGCRTKIRTGGEVAESIVSALDDDELRAVSLGGGGRWILLEPAPGPLSDGLDDTVRQLTDRGFRSLIAHPERHLGADLLDRLGKLTRAGSLVQVTAAALSDPETAEGMAILARAGVLHVLASDSHSSRFGRPVAITLGLERLWEFPLLSPHVDWIAWRAPEAIISGQDTEAPYSPRVEG